MRRLVFASGVALTLAAACATFDATSDAPPPSVDAGDADSAAGETDAALDSAVDAATCAQPAGVSIIDGGCLELLASGQADPRSIAVVPIAKKIVWTVFGPDAGGGRLVRAELDGTNAADFSLADTGWHPTCVTARDGVVFWTEQSDSIEAYAAGAVRSKPIAGGSMTDISTTTAAPHGIDVTDAYVYWTSFKPSYENDVYRFDRDGGTAAVIQDGLVDPVGVAADDDGPVFAVAGNETTNPGSVSALLVDGGSWTAVRTAGVHPWGVAVSPPDVFWAEWAEVDGGVTGSIVRVQRADGANGTLLCADQPKPQYLATTTTHVYFVNGGGSPGTGEVRRVSRIGGACEVVVGGLADPSGIAVAGGFVYFTTRGDGRVWRLRIQ